MAVYWAIDTPAFAPFAKWVVLHGNRREDWDRKRIFHGFSSATCRNNVQFGIKKKKKKKNPS
jgi:hypothetical protein